MVVSYRPGSIKNKKTKQTKQDENAPFPPNYKVAASTTVQSMVEHNRAGKSVETQG